MFFIVLVIFFIQLLILIPIISLNSSHPNENVSNKRNKKYVYKVNAKLKGEDGESIVEEKLGDNIPGVKYVFNDYKFLFNNNSVQIDHILVNKNGVFCIETKNYSGKIYGNDDQHEWTQVLAYGNVKNKFYNPVKQNSSHIYKLSKILPANIHIVSVIIFINANIENVESESSYVLYADELDDFVNSNGKELIESYQINIIAELLNKNKINVSEDDHIEGINKLKSDIDHNICPRCGARLVIRNSCYGIFYGCKNFPKCKFKKKID